MNTKIRDYILTVSVAAYNAEKDISRCIESFLKCDYFFDMEIIIVNDGSTDDTENKVKKYVEEYSDNIKLVSKENGGHGSTINTSIRLAKGKYYKVVDADDWIDPANLDALVKMIIETDVDLVISPYYEVSANDGSKKIIDPIDKKYNNRGLCVKISDLVDYMSISMHSMTFKTEIVKKMGAIIDEKCFYVDTEYTVFPLEYVKNVIVTDKPIYNYLLGTSTQSMNIDNMRKRREQHLVVTKRLVEYYESKKQNLNDKVLGLIKRRIVSVAMMQYIIYVGLKCESCKKEVVDYDKWLKNKSIDVYRQVIEEGKRTGSGFMKIIQISRLTGYRLYNPITKAFQKIGIIH